MKGMSRAVRTCVRSSLVAVAMVGALATTARAQDSTLANGVRTHAVHAGETLWDIAQAYLGDGDLWPEITRLNPRLVQDPHWIFPNEILRIPPRLPGMPDNYRARSRSADGTAAGVASPVRSPLLLRHRPQRRARRQRRPRSRRLLRSLTPRGMRRRRMMRDLRLRPVQRSSIIRRRDRTCLRRAGSHRRDRVASS